jgi:hypothetical protein
MCRRSVGFSPQPWQGSHPGPALFIADRFESITGSHRKGYAKRLTQAMERASGLATSTGFSLIRGCAKPFDFEWHDRAGQSNFDDGTKASDSGAR